MTKKHKNYQGYLNRNGLYRAASEQSLKSVLPVGIYTLTQDMEGSTYFKEVESTHDQLVDLPDPAFERVVGEMEHFLKEETRTKFSELGFLYKRSSLLYGLPGTGKTSIVNRVIKNVIHSEGIVLLNPHPGYLIDALEILKELQPHSIIMVIFEELDQLVSYYESELLNILDGEIQKENVIYLATTNFISKVPPRLMRPGRFSSVIEVGYPNFQARNVYLSTKLDADRAWRIAKQADGLSIDELKEVVQSVECFGYEAEEVIKRIKKIKELAGKDDREDSAGDLYLDSKLSKHEAREYNGN